jgi:hypothetical protein
MSKRLIALLTIITVSAVNTFAQRSGDDPAGAACGALGCGVFGLVYVLFLVAIFGGAIALIVFIVKFIRKDAIARGMPNADSIKWLGLLGLLGLLIYLLQRPQGNCAPCPSCGQNRMQGLPVCSWCGNA